MSASGTDTPEALVRLAIGSLARAIDADADGRAGHAAALLRKVWEHFLPYTIWDRATQLTAGRYWRQAAPDQRMRIAHEYRQLMLLTYVEALLPVRAGAALEVEPAGSGDADADADADADTIVRTRIAGAAGAALALDYRLARTPSGWRIYDLKTGGGWFIMRYQQAFAEEVQRNGYVGLRDRLRREKEGLAARLGVAPD
ncbi:phospholipid-binding protein MlaC [uncultured Massilia sp.]|uniref:MlaC/ttg2D family ABC transporter substrate-binding protein n=1 Tax=uncultured Massilia sp. TaxID=169973 RepID=UPI0025DE5903|nr:ABC transporter substrate-binding protein [uncultured Massilia sp.]